MWYLYALVFWHLTLPILCWLRDRWRLPGALPGAGACRGAGVGGPALVEWPFTLVRVVAFYPFYAFGVLFRPQTRMRLAAAAAEKCSLRRAALAALLVGYGAVFPARAAG